MNGIGDGVHGSTGKKKNVITANYYRPR